MEREAAYELANLWHELPETENPNDAYDRVAAAARQFLPEDIRGSADAVNGVAAVVAFDADSFYTIHPDPSEDAPSSVLLTARYPMDAAATVVGVRDGIVNDRGDQVREWTFTFGQLPPLTLTTYLRRSNDWSGGVSDSERFARELAERLGWKAPFEYKRQ